MGRSDPIIFSKYLQVLESEISLKKIKEMKACFLGFPGPNSFTQSLSPSTSVFYDLSLNNWNINDENWNIEEASFDIVIATRLAYFSKNPKDFFLKCNKILKPGGFLFVDWGLGDHWRFDDYKVGWVKNGNHEYAYAPDNFLWSTVWDDAFLSQPDVKKFSRWIEKFGYHDLKSAIIEEVPEVLMIKECLDQFDLYCDMIALWEESPQLYTIICGKKRL